MSDPSATPSLVNRAIAARPPGPLPQPASLRALAFQAQQRRLPLVLMVTVEACPFCATVRQHYLLPLQAAGQMLVAELNMRDRRTPLQDFNGQSVTAHAQARAWGVRIAPTLLFLDANGREVAPRMEGIGSEELYGAFLEQRLQQARSAVGVR